MYNYIYLYLLTIAGIFIEFSFLGTVGNFLLKIVIFACISYFLYELWKNRLEADLETTLISTDDQNQAKENSFAFLDIEPTQLTVLLKNEKKYGEFLVNQFFIIWNFILPHNGYLFYKNSEGSLRLMHKQLQQGLAWHSDFDPSGFSSIIDSKEKILIENNIEPAGKLLPFYGDQDYKPRSLLALTTNFDSSEKLYWIFDADTPDFFNVEDAAVLKSINDNTLSIISAALQNSGLAKEYKNIERKLQIANQLNSVQNLNECIDKFCEILSEEFEASKLTIAVKIRNDNESNKAVIKKAIGIDDPFKTGYEFALDEGLNGWVILKNKPYLLDDIDKGEFFVPRFSKEEKSNYDLRSFLSIPFQLESEAIGMVTLEHKEINKYNNEHKNRLIDYCNILSFALRRFKGLYKIK